MAYNFTGKVVVITGASSGAGEATARHLAKLNATVVLGARRLDRLQALVADITAAGGKALAVKTDVSVQADVTALVDAAVKAYGRVDVLLNNAGIMPLAPLESVLVDEWHAMIDVNIKGTLYGIAAVLPIMKAQKSGQILTVSSVYGHVVGPNAAVYCATKHAVRALTEGLRQEVKPYNIRTTIISPGAMKTELLAVISDKEVQAGCIEFVDQFGVEPTSFARMVAFAMSEPEDVDVNEILFRPTAQPM